MTVRILTGDVFDHLAELPDESVHCVVTSPPYWGLRDYGVDGAIGLEATFEQHLGTLVDVFAEVRRVLRSDGTLWLNYGDAYAGSWGAQSRGNPCVKTSTLSGGQGTHTGSLKRTPTLKPKDLMMMPARVAMALQADGWWLRSEIVWHKPNPMPESVTDRPTSAHEKLFLLAKSARYFYDAEAVRVPYKYGRDHHRNILDLPESHVPCAAKHTGLRVGSQRPDKQRGHGRRHVGFNGRWDAMAKEEQQSNGANLRNVWNIATHPYPGAHFATFPPAFVNLCINAGTSECGRCVKCGAPWVRQVRVGGGTIGQSWHDHSDDGAQGQRSGGMSERTNLGNGTYRRETAGWCSSCECDEDEPLGPCTVLDPFGGSGTVGLVADRLGRDAILIELNPAYADMAHHRILDDAPLFADVTHEPTTV